MTRWIRGSLATVLAAIAAAGLFASTTNDLRIYAPMAFSPAWLVPVLIALGALVAAATPDGIWAAGSMGAAALLAALLVGAALSAPGIEVEPIRTTMINKGTIQGLAAFLVILIFGMIGVVASLVLRSIIGHGDV